VRTLRHLYGYATLLSDYRESMPAALCTSLIVMVIVIKEKKTSVFRPNDYCSEYLPIYIFKFKGKLNVKKPR